MGMEVLAVDNLGCEIETKIETETENETVTKNETVTEIEPKTFVCGIYHGQTLLS
jgi:hypothetical protein